MKRWIAYVCLSVLAGIATGCALPLPGSSTTTGWSFTVTKPATVTTSAVVSHGEGAYAIAPVASVPTGAVFGPARPLAVTPADPCVTQGPGASRPTLAFSETDPSCTLEEVCRRLARLEAAQKLPARPMPQAQP
jgi:hypothetical protein